MRQLKEVLPCYKKVVRGKVFWGLRGTENPTVPKKPKIINPPQKELTMAAVCHIDHSSSYVFTGHLAICGRKR